MVSVMLTVDFQRIAPYFRLQLEEKMSELSREEIRERFTAATNFNEIFDAFESAINQKTVGAVRTDEIPYAGVR